MNNQLSNKILERIEEEKIAPIPHWRFSLFRSYFWLLAVISTVVGALSVAAIMFLIFDIQNQGVLNVSHDFIELLWMVPFVWIISLILFTGITRICLNNTKRGYQYRFRSVFVGSMVISIVFGSLLHLMGIGKLTHESLNDVHIYRATAYDARDAWSEPKFGRLGGVVATFGISSTTLSIVDFNGVVWTVTLSSTTSQVLNISSSSTVRIIGMIDGTSTNFIAESVYEWSK